MLNLRYSLLSSSKALDTERILCFELLTLLNAMKKLITLEMITRLVENPSNLIGKYSFHNI